MRKGTSRKWISLLAAIALLFGSLPAAYADGDDGGGEQLLNLLAQDIDTRFDGGSSPFSLDSSSSGGSQQIVQVNGNNALELRDASLSANAASSFTVQLTTGALVSRMNEIYDMPVGSAPVEFLLEYKLMRSAASSKPVNKDIYAQIQLGPFDNVLIPRFPAQYPSITGTAAYTNTTPGVLGTVNDADLPSYRFQVVPNGGQKHITSFKLTFGVRVDTGGTDEAIVVDDLAVYEVNSPVAGDDEAPTEPEDLTAANVTDTGVDLSWTAATDDTAVTRYDLYQDGTLKGTYGGTTTSASIIGLTPNHTYVYAVKARDAAGNESPLSDELSATTLPSVHGLPEPYGDRDIGSVHLAGGSSYDANTGTFTVQGNGADIWGTDDAFHYVYQPWTGDGEVIAKVTSLANSVAWTKAGVMIRTDITPQSQHAMMAVTPSNSIVFEDRLQTGGATTLSAGASATAPYWVKLVRKGNMITAFNSSNGTTWTMVKREQINLPETVYFGLALTSHDNNRLTTAMFDNVFIGPVPPEDNNYAPFPGTPETRRQWIWDKTKSMAEIGGIPNIVQNVAQLKDGENTASNLTKLNTMFQQYDYEQYKTVSKMYAYLMVGDQFDSALIGHVKDYFASYAYAKLPQTENLRMSNYTAGYLVGQYLPDVVDLNGVSGSALKALNRANVEEMIDAAVHEGWAEYESPEYTFMTYFCLNALYQWTDEPDFKQEIKMAMDVMWFEWANDWIDGNFISTTSRAKGDSVSANDPTWRGADHTMLSWMYFGANRAQQGFGESDSLAPSAYRPWLEYLGMVAYSGMDYTPPEMAVRIGQNTAKDYSSRKTNLQNSSGRNLKTYRTAYVKPTWGLSTEVTYNRVDNWIEDIPVALRWQSDKPDSLFRLSVDQGTATVGNYDQPENHRIMQDGTAAIGVYKSLGGPNATDNYINAMFPDTGSILTRDEQSGWVFAETGPVYFAFKMIKPYGWYYQTPYDPSNKVKATAQVHPANTLTYSYNILRSRADKNGWILQTAAASDYANFTAFKNAVLTGTSVDSSHIDDSNPRLTYTALNGDVMDITFDLASGSYAGTHKINGSAIDYGGFKLFDTPWLQQEPNADLFVASEGGETVTYNFADWTITQSGQALTVPNGGFESGAAGPDSWSFAGLAGSSVGSRDDGTAKSGEHSAKIANASDVDEGRWSLAEGSLVAVDPGKEYTFSAQAKTDAVNATYGARAGISFYAADGETVTGSTYRSAYASGTNDWTPISVTARPPAGAAFISLDVELKGAGTVWFDDAKLVSRDIVAATGVQLDHSTLSLGTGQTAGLNATVEPADATNKAVVWSSSDAAVATVDAGGAVTGVSPGTAVIAATTVDGSLTATCAVTVTLQPLFQDSFAGGIGGWDLFGSTAWQVQGSGAGAHLTGSTTLGSPQRAVAKQSLLPYTSANYSLAFTAAGNRFRTMFRYSSGTSYYFLEFKDTDQVELWKYPNASTPAQVGAVVDIGSAVAGFDMTDSHTYRVDVSGSSYKLYADGVLAASFTDSSLTAGGIGFALKSVGPAASLTLDDVTVLPISAS